MSLICTKCKATNIDEARFCKNCGANIAEELKKKYEHQNEEELNRKKQQQIDEGLRLRNLAQDKYAQEQAEKPTKEHEINDIFDGDSDLMRRYKQEKQDNSYFKEKQQSSNKHTMNAESAKLKFEQQISHDNNSISTGIGIMIIIAILIIIIALF